MQGDTTRKGRHRRRRELGKWQGKRSDDAPAPAERTGGRRLDHVHDRQASAVVGMAKTGFAPRQIAKRLGLNLGDVERILGAEERP